MDCLREPGCHLEVVDDPSSLEMEVEIVCVPEREPGVADVIWRDVDFLDDEGEKGGTCFVKDEFEKQAAASEGVTNQRRAAASGGKATV